LPQATQTWPTLTTVQQPVETMIATATQLLIDEVGAGGSCPKQLVLACKLMIRESVAAPLL